MKRKDRTRATDDSAVSNQAFLYPGDPRVIAPSRSSSIRRTSSLTDLDEEFASAVRRARDSRPGLGFGLGLAKQTGLMLFRELSEPMRMRRLSHFILFDTFLYPSVSQVFLPIVDQLTKAC